MVESLCGLANGAIPLVTDIVSKSSSNGGDITGFFVKKERKPHGLQKTIEGNILEPAVILDDVMTTGHSIRLAIDAVREENNEPEQTCKSTSLFRHSDFKQLITEQIKRKKKTKIGE